MKPVDSTHSDGSCPVPSRRTFLAQSLGAAGLLGLGTSRGWSVEPLQVRNITELYPVDVARIEGPRSTEEVGALIRGWQGQIGIGGGRYSMGGQVAVRGGLHIDMRQMNRVIHLNAEAHTVRVQAGIRWRDLQDHLDPLGLAVKTMQSYSNFTVGGSLAVNCHGRYVGHGPIANTVRALQLVLADGTVVEASGTQHPDLFQAAIGGYGAIGVIAEVELEIADNVRIERSVESIPLPQYFEYFREQILADRRSVLHNADLVPPDFNAPGSITWRRAPESTPLTETARLVPRDQPYVVERSALWAVSALPGGEVLRSAVIRPLQLDEPKVTWLNHEASLDVAELEPWDRSISTYALQEYFVPKEAALRFIGRMVTVLQAHGVDALNISIRHAPADTVSLLKWAPVEVFCFVLYY